MKIDRVVTVKIVIWKTIKIVEGELESLTVDSPEKSVSLLLQAAVGGLLVGDWAPPGSDGDRADQDSRSSTCA